MQYTKAEQKKNRETKLKANNLVNILHPYRTKHGTWVYDDEDLGVYGEAFVCGSSEVIDALVGMDTKEFTLIISREPIPGYDAKIARLIEEEKKDGIVGWYQLEGTEMKHWLCSCTTDYFEGYPLEIFIKVEQFKK